MIPRLITHRLFKVPLAVLSLAWLLTACEPSVEGAASSPKASADGGGGRDTHWVETASATQRTVPLSAVRTGTLSASRVVKIFNQEEGRITTLDYYESDEVRKGDTLLRIDDAVLQAQLAKTVAQRRQAEQDLKRLEKLVKQRLVSDDERARAATAYAVAKAEEALLRTRLAYTGIEAPLSGIITERLVEVGDVVPKHTHVLTIMDPASLITSVQVSELILPYLKIGDTVDVTIDALNERVSGKIVRIFPTIDARSRQGTVEVQLTQVPKAARAGQLCRVHLSAAPQARLMIPFNALRRRGNDEFVYVVDERGRAQQQIVNSGLRHDNWIEIRQGLNNGDEVVTKGFLGLKDGKKVNPVPARSAPEKTKDSSPGPA